MPSIVVRGLVLDPSGRVLLVSHAPSQFWYTPGGHLRDDAEIDIDLQPGELLLFDNLALAHGRRGKRQPGELRQRVYGHRLEPAAQRKLRNHVLTAFGAQAGR
jgi:8-oxo-dGTP pyrophosphatase MutT (NUDIX family)